MDLTQNATVGTTDLEIERLLVVGLAPDHPRGNILVPYGRGPYDVAALDLKTLGLKGHLDYRVNHAPGGDPAAIRFAFPPSGGEFLARWWNPAAAGGTGAFEIATIDATTFRRTASRVTSPPLAERFMLEATGRQLYSITQRRPARIDVFDVPGFLRTSTIDLEALLNPAAFGRGIDDFGSGKILIVENEKTTRTEADRFTLFVYDLSTGRTTPRIRTNLEGDARLLPRTNRLLFDEQMTLTPGAELVRPGVDMVSLGKLHVYDTATGNRLATVAISDVQTGKVLGISAAEDAFYYLSFGPARPDAKLSVISLTSFSIVKELTLPIHDYRMVFFDE